MFSEDEKNCGDDPGFDAEDKSINEEVTAEFKNLRWYEHSKNKMEKTDVGKKKH